MLTANEGCGRCARCGDDKPPVRASRLLAWVVVPLAWILLFAVGLGSALCLGLNLVLIPCWFACACALGPLARKLLDPKCGSCGEPRGSTSTAYVARRPPRPADERAVEGRLVGEA
jgi:hypothetical protein